MKGLWLWGGDPRGKMVNLGGMGVGGGPGGQSGAGCPGCPGGWSGRGYKSVKVTLSLFPNNDQRYLFS